MFILTTHSSVSIYFISFIILMILFSQRAIKVSLLSNFILCCPYLKAISFLAENILVWFRRLLSFRDYTFMLSFWIDCFLSGYSFISIKVNIVNNHIAELSVSLIIFSLKLWWKTIAKILILLATTIWSCHLSSICYFKALQVWFNSSIFIFYLWKQFLL